MADKFKKSIYLAGELVNIYDECKNNRSRSFSGRVADIADRYTILMDLADVPELTDSEKVILGEAVLGGFIDKLKIKYLPESILDTELPQSKELADKVSKLDYSQRLKLIESIGI